jgi:5-methylcytosine-specific restriction endonuclease McrA
VFRLAPFTIILKREVSDAQIPFLQLKIDPGSKTTGIAIVNQQTGEVVFAAEIEHQGHAIRTSLDARRAVRRGRRNRKTRYRKPRFNNRRRPEGWLPPSLESRVENVYTWAQRLRRVYPIMGVAMELVKFDMQLMENPEINGVEYQQGELAGYELREYLLLKFGHQCSYQQDESPCDEYLEVGHIIPRSRGGSNRVSNLTIACHKHNREKGDATAAEYGFPEVEAWAKRPLKKVFGLAISSGLLCRRARNEEFM